MAAFSDSPAETGGTWPDDYPRPGRGVLRSLTIALTFVVLGGFIFARLTQPALSPPTAEEVALAARLLAAGIYHGDLHGDNFVLLDSGALAVLDMQSARVFRRGADARRRAVAARMLRELGGADEQAAAAAMRAAGLLRSDFEVERALQESAGGRAAYQRSRVRRCLQESTEFERRVTWRGVRHARRDRPRRGRWIARGGALGDAWLGQRGLELKEGRAPLFGAYFRKWWWLGRGEGLYVSDSCSEAQIRAELDVARAVGRAWRGRPSA